MPAKLLIVDIKDNNYIFDDQKVIINNIVKGIGRIITPIQEIALQKQVRFIINENGKDNKYMTSPVKGCFLSTD